MDFGYFIILGASIMNVFLLKTFGLGLFMVNESRNAKDKLFGCGCVFVVSGVQSFALVYWLKSFIEQEKNNEQTTHGCIY